MLYRSYPHLQSGSYLQLAWSRFKETGHTFTFYQLGTEKILTIDPENIKAVLSTQFSDFALGNERAEHFEPFIGHGIFTADGEAWQRSRQLVRPCFRTDDLSGLARFEEHVVNLLVGLPRDREAKVDLQELFLHLTIDIASEFLLGQSKSLLKGKNIEQGKSFATAFRRSQEAMLRYFALGRLSDLVPRSKQEIEDKAVMREFVTPFVTRAMEAKNDRSASNLDDLPAPAYTFASRLAETTTDFDAISGNLLNILLAGRDTTASLLSSMFFVLSRNPNICERLKMEVSETVDVNCGLPTLEQLRSMPYLKACINECLRLYPPVPRNSRTAVRDTTLPRGGGPDGTQPLGVPKGTQVGYQIFSMHRRRDIFGEDAEDFIPERWINRSLRPGWGYLPFNGGPRICLGQQFAINQASYVTVRLLQHFESLHAADEKPWTEDLGLSCSLKHGVRVFVRVKSEANLQKDARCG
ncbi:hypothetical protein M409DRAFT_62362 [Zasmidium cellare ATCC 36951]|uniref:Cytochrome P450 n=1 Tax=Zasmidium cellare ATCC 36951 TaxID=1080233 RepID=A0A6A6D9G1_ZASCE|nr:uncharacterized protein M409DRAFT_62362 [Zasmidium cellare ATCC 36951]KAF2174286.1 hypothetical protein M409DRAFT_62362 [Zasmidium cellare ATCC 36951]